MKRILVVVILLLICLPIFSQEVSINDITGKVEIKKANTTNWVPAQEGMKMDLSDTVSTGFNSSAVLLVDSSTVSLKPLTRMTLDVLLKKEGALNTSLFLRVGAVRAKVDNTSLSQNFNIQSPYSTASVRGTLFDFDGLRLDVYEGAVAFFQGPPVRIIQAAALEAGVEEEEEDGEAPAEGEGEASPEGEGDTPTEGEGEEPPEGGDEAPAEVEREEVIGETLESGASGEEVSPAPIAETGAAADEVVLAMASQYNDETAIFVQAGNSVEITLPVVYIPPAEEEPEEESAPDDQGEDEDPAEGEGEEPPEDDATPQEPEVPETPEPEPTPPPATPVVTPPPAPPAPPQQTNIIIDWSSN